MLTYGIGRKSFRAFLAENPTLVPIDHSRLELWDRCHRKFDYIVNHKLPDSVGVAAYFSSKIIHPVLSAWYRGESSETAVTGATWKKLWKDFTDVLMVRPTSEGDTALYTLHTAQLAYNTYIERYALDHSMYEFVSSEELYWRMIPGIDKFVWFSLPDLILKKKADGKLVNVDFKFSKWDINRDLSPFDRQFLGQAYAADTEFMMKAHIQTMTEPGSKKPYDVNIVRTFCDVDTQLMTEWLNELRATLAEMSAAQASGVYVKRSPRTCYDFRNTCEFLSLCSIGPTRDIVIESMEKSEPLAYVWEDR